MRQRTNVYRPQYDATVIGDSAAKKRLQLLVAAAARGRISSRRRFSGGALAVSAVIYAVYRTPTHLNGAGSSAEHQRTAAALHAVAFAILHAILCTSDDAVLLHRDCWLPAT